MLPSRSVILAEAICMTIRPEFRVPTDLFLLFAHDHSTKIYGPLSFNLSFVHDRSTKNYGSHWFISFTWHDHSTKIYGLLSFIFSFVHGHSTKTEGRHWFIFLFAHDYLTKMYCPLSFILSFVYDHSTKIRVLINFFLSVHNHLTKVRSHSYSLIYSFLCRCFVCYIQGSTSLIFRLHCFWQ